MADPLVLARHVFLVGGGLMCPQLLLLLQAPGQGLLPSPSLRQQLLEILQLQLEVSNGVSRLGELSSPADDRSLRLYQGAVERALLAGQLEGLLLQLISLCFQLLHLVGVGQGLGIERLSVPLLQLMSSTRDRGLELLP